MQITIDTAAIVRTPKPGLDHRTVWRWHFYAGLFCIPFILWLSVTGTIFLFHPQIQRWLDRPYDHLSTTGPQATVNDQVKAALAAVPGSSLHSYQLPFTNETPAQVLVGKGLKEFRVYLQPRTLAVLKVDDEDHRIDKFISRLHGELLLGDIGSWIVELAASWAVIMIVTGLFLWWPSNAKGLGGVLYPRLRQGQRIFWRDIHAITGIYISFFALFLLFTGLPWAKSWGAYLKTARHLTGTAAIKQDWTTSSKAEIAERSATARSTSADTMPGMDMSSHSAAAPPASPDAYKPIDLMVATVAPLGLTNPVLISPPRKPGGNWTAKSDTRDRPLRVDLVLDPKTGAILKRTDFSQKAWIDRVVGTGIAAHEGQLFGLANQFVGLFTTIGLVTLSVSGLIMWRRRRPEGVLGAPVPIRRVRFLRRAHRLPHRVRNLHALPRRIYHPRSIYRAIRPSQDSSHKNLARPQCGSCAIMQSSSQQVLPCCVHFAFPSRSSAPPRFAAQSHPQVLQVSTLYDGRGNILHDTRIVVQDGKILRIDPKATGDLVDLRGLTVMPGWIDLHVHMTYHFGMNGKYGERVCAPSAAATRHRPPHPHPTSLARPRLRPSSPSPTTPGPRFEAGFTTVQSVGAPGDKDLRDFIDRGEIPGPRILTALRPITDEKLTPDQIRAWVRQVKADGGDLIKIFASKSIREGGGRTLDDAQLSAACGEAKAQGLRSLVHAYGPAVRAATLAGCTQIEHGTLSETEDLKLMAEHGTYFDPQAGLVIHNYLDNRAHFEGSGNFNDEGFASMEKALPLNAALVRQAVNTPGLKVVFGTDAVAGAHGRNAEEFIYRVNIGQAPMAALVAAQSLAAESLNLQNKIGAIAPGLDADIIALQGDPLKDITAVRRVAFVMKAGAIYKLTPVK